MVSLLAAQVAASGEANPVPVMRYSVCCLGNELFWQITKIDAASFVPIRLARNSFHRHRSESFRQKALIRQKRKLSVFMSNGKEGGPCEPPSLGSTYATSSLYWSVLFDHHCRRRIVGVRISQRLNERLARSVGAKDQ